MELCIWKTTLPDLNPMWSRGWFYLSPLLQWWQALCAFCSTPSLQQGRYLWIATLCPHHCAQPVDGDSPDLPLLHAAGSSPWLALNLQKCWEVPGGWETKMECRPSRSLFMWKPYVSMLNEQRTCSFFYRDGFPWELCYERDFTLCKRPGKKLSWKSEKWRL